MNTPKIISFLAFICIALLSTEKGLAERCTECHKESFQFSRFHAPYLVSCEQCHGGNPQAVHKESAHFGMEAYPGRMASVERSCGQSQCHADLVPQVKNSIMNTLDGMLTVTREVYNAPNPHHQNRTVAERLAFEGADLYLRKLCVSCHLGSERQNHQQSYRDRGGGCAACHLQTYQKKEIPPLDDDPDITGLGTTHPTLTIQVPNDRCFGCHSRSGRISLNYLGLAETDELDKNNTDRFGYLYDNRLVERKAADVHHKSDMACIDCHTTTGLMGTGDRFPFLRDQNDISCEDCHSQQLRKRPVSELKPRERRYFALYKDKIPISVTDQVIVTRKFQTPLFHVIDRAEERVMISKLDGRELQIPLTEEAYYHTVSGHERLTCDACHTGWAPQCYGCHVSYDPEGIQWDHIERERTPGRWVETRWQVKSERPALGVTGNNRITTFIPGMNIIAEATPVSQKFIKRIFSATSAHTTQTEGRSCESCHRSDESMGIIDKWVAHPEQKNWITPLGWIFEDQKTPGKGTKPGDRSFNQNEIEEIRRVGVCLECHSKEDPIYQRFSEALNNLAPQCQTN